MSGICSCIAFLIMAGLFIVPFEIIGSPQLSGKPVAVLTQTAAAATPSQFEDAEFEQRQEGSGLSSLTFDPNAAS